MTRSIRPRLPAPRYTAASVGESRGSSNRYQTTHRSAITNPANATYATASLPQTPARAVFVADKIAKVRELALRAAWQLNKPKNRAKLAHYRASLETLRRVDGNTLLIHRLDSPIPGARGRRNSQPRTGRDRDRLELGQASSSSNLNDVRPRSRGIGRKVARPPRRMPSVGRARVAVGAGSIRSLLGTKPARDGRPLRFSDFRAADKPIAVT
jgi:hypothetical protein